MYGCAGGWQEDLTAAQLSHATHYGHLGAALALLSTLCGLAESAPGLVELVMVWAAPACILALSTLRLL